MSEIILHAGMNKTGSTSIQKSFAGYDDDKLFYARFGNSNHTVAVHTLFRDYEQEVSRNGERGRKRDEFDALLKTEQEHLDTALSKLKTRERMLISAEGIVGMHPAELKKMRDALTVNGDKVRVVAYVREPVSYASSAFQQGVKFGLNSFHVPQPRYIDKFRKIDDVFGRENVSYWRFDTGAFPNKSVVQDFVAHIDADLSHIREVRTNESLSRRSTALMYLFNKERSDNKGVRSLYKARKMMVSILSAFDSFEAERRKADLSDKLEPEQLKRWAKTQKFNLSKPLVVDWLSEADIRWMEGRSGIDLMPKKKTKKADLKTSISSEQDIMDVANDSGPYIRRLLNLAKIKPSNDTPLAALDALFAHALDKVENPQVEELAGQDDENDQIDHWHLKSG